MSKNSSEQEEHLKTLYSAHSASAQEFDKQCLYIASGAFSLSFAFITDIVPNLEKTLSKNLLIWAWSLFLCVIFMGLLGHWISTIMHHKAIVHAAVTPEAYNRKIKPWNFSIQTLNIMSILGLGIGCLMLILFINKNLNSPDMGKQNKPSPTITDTQRPKPGVGSIIPPKVQPTKPKNSQ